MKYTGEILFVVVGLVAALGLFFACLIKNEGFSGESLYDLMEKEAQISNDVYLQKIRDADVIQSNPWIMIEPVNKNATIHPRGVLDRLTGQQSYNLSWHPRAYYDYSDVVYTGLPL